MADSSMRPLNETDGLPAPLPFSALPSESIQYTYSVSWAFLMMTSMPARSAALTPSKQMSSSRARRAVPCGSTPHWSAFRPKVDTNQR
eukprot:4068593-Pyramimonas_sp.AAC.1